ncbi:MAG: GspH/FimT family pseudopilin [Sphingosinicella sp.]|uniref:GspH/FimT family pseudopilin n=1 Tax=Sphingosinicella sp. TaxID=1917971 RepID=UPI004037779C
MRSSESGFESWRRSAEHGFTLVELMVVIVIIALAATAVALAIPEPGGSVQAEAERFAARAKAARDNAIVESRPAMLQAGPGGYDIARRSGGAWQPPVHYDWGEGTEVAGGSTRFDTTGLAEPLTVTLRRGGRAASVEIRGDGTVHVRR